MREFMRALVRNVSPIPKSLRFAQAAAVPVASLTAYQSLFHAETGRVDRLSFEFFRLNDPEGGSCIEMTRVAEQLEDSTCAPGIVTAVGIFFFRLPGAHSGRWKAVPVF
jgi:hypothetical protein